MHTALIILIAALITAMISGLFGMAGGMIFMGIITIFLGVPEAMIVHGAVQGLSNSYRAFLLRANIRWDIFGFHAIGALPAIIGLAFIVFIPSKAFVYFALGLLPFILWLPRGWMQGDAERPRDAVMCGFMVIGLNLTAGIAGPALDFFYVRTGLSRLEIVATKAVTMFAAHMVKIAFFGLPLILAGNLSGLPPAWVFIAVIPCAMLGTYTGTSLLHRLSDIQFKSYTKYLVTLDGSVYLWRGFTLTGFLL
ncbi:MAG: sulfite exporter TauE/SafE family protein [Maricaulaceae bacterium]